MVTKLKVKDLAAELGIGHKEILQQLRDMDIQVKTFMSTLEDGEAESLRQSLRAQPAAKTEVVRREVGDVIVRSRKAKPGDPEQKAAPAPAPADESAEAPAKSPAVKPAAKPSEDETPAVAAQVEQPREEAPKARRVEEAAEKPADKPARIITPQEAPVVEAKTKAKPVVAATEAKTEPKAARIVSKPAPQPEPGAEAAAVAAPEVAAPAQAPAEQPVAESKSKPAPQAVAETVVAEAPAPAAGVPAADAPVEAAAPQAETGSTEELDEDGKKKRKPKREVPVSAAPQVRIISRPEPGSTPPTPPPSRRPEFSAGHDGGARPYTPHPGGARPAYDGPRGGGYGGGAAAPGQRPAAPGGYQRPPSSAPGSSYGFPRPPSSAPGSSYGQQRPTGPGGPGGPGIAPVVPPKEGEDRARRKPHRVVEFTPGGGSEEDRRKAAGAAAKKKTNFAPAPVVSEDGESPMRLKSSRRGKKHRGGVEQREEIKPVGKRKIRIDEHIRLSDLAHQMGIKSQAIIKALFSMGVMATINQALDMDTATLLASEFGHEVENVSFDEQEFLVVGEPDTAEDLKPRPPVVTIMGHVDHGKTSLLDAIRMTSIASGEAGGITQHIGAYHVSTSRGEVVFLDTPGHEAFTTMRARGAQVTDIVVLVVAADDGVMDQTREAVNHAKAAKVPIVVAVNKIDKEGANPDRVKRELAEFDLVPEEWGGTTIFANVSAKQRIGLDELLEMIVLQAEVLELKANPAKPARGHIVEAKLDKGRGPLGTVLIQDGTLKNGDAFVCGTVHGKVRAMFNDQGRKIKQAGPAIPVEIQGFDVVPEAGDEFVVVADDKVARKIAESRASKQREKDLVGKSKVTLESFLLSKPADEAKILNLVLKADVQGSLEAITEAVNKLSTEEVKIQVVHGATGGLTESDILLASASQAIIIGFNVRPTAKVKDMADSEHVEIRFYDIIYKLVGEIKDAMSGMLTPDIQEVYLGQAEVRETFSVPKVGMVAGCGVVDGKLTRSAKVRLLRDGVVIYTGALNSLRRFKDDAKEVAKGYECGVGLENFNDIKIGDVIEAFETKEVARTID
ncbi:MAG: translation initiation factor IF-2 [Deltaproteobacteria bacterium HGW-Deltaproteobacteria-8]|jgi:translation initiation factor IF-2|nr:MAG: translation initiation factor IF-2 [Deltaproteobacteria bacterium HGW-Deltaproteobacteria-8]